MNHWKAHLALFTVALIYGANYVIAKEVMDEQYIQPFGFVALRVSSGIVLFSLFHHFFIKEKIQNEDIPQFLICALLGVVINQLCFFKGLELTKPINASLIMTITPIMVFVFSAYLLKEKITHRKVLGIIFGVLGAILLIVMGNQSSISYNGLQGDILIFVNGSSYALYLVKVKGLLKKYHPITVVKWVFIFGSILIVPIGAQQLSAVSWSDFGPNIWLAVLYVLLCTTFLAYLLNAVAIKSINPSIAGIYIYLQPLVASTLAICIGRDQLTNWKLLAGLLIIVGVYLVSFSSKSTKSTKII